MKKMLFLAVFLAALVLVSFSTPSHALDVAKCVCIGPNHEIGNHRCMHHFVFLHKMYMLIDPKDPIGLRGYIGDQPFETLVKTGKVYDPVSGWGCIRE